MSDAAASKRPRTALPHALTLAWLSLRDLAVTVGPFVGLALLLLLLAYWVLDPQPPRQMVLATGPERSAYAEFGARYARQMARQGITVKLRTTEGAAENLALLRQPGSGVDAAFVQGGSDAPPDADGATAGSPSAGLEALGSLFHEPVWLFYRQDAAQRLLQSDSLSSLAQLPGWRLDIGAPGSGGPPLVQRLVEANGMKLSALSTQRVGDTPAVVGLLDGTLDALVLVQAPESLFVQMLLRTPGIRLLDVAQAEAYARRMPFLSPVTLPRGIVDLATDQPPQDVRLVAPTALLVARETTHPALVQLLVQAAHVVHGDAGWLQRKAEFPNARVNEYPLAPEAERYYRNGPPWLQHWLPFWLANLVERMGVVLVSIVAVLIPLARVVPPVYQFRIRSRVFRWYGRLRAVEDGIGHRPPDALLRELAAIETSVGRINVPLSYADELYALRSHIAMVRRRLTDTAAPATDG